MIGHSYQYVSNADVKTPTIQQRRGYPYDDDSLAYDYYDSFAVQNDYDISIIHKIVKGKVQSNN